MGHIYKSEIKQCLYCKINRALDLFYLVRVYLLCFMARERQIGDSLKKFTKLETCLNICTQRGRVKVGRCSCRRPWRLTSFYHECTARAESWEFFFISLLDSRDPPLGQHPVVQRPCQDLKRDVTAFVPFGQCRSGLSALNSVQQSKQQGVFDININDFTGIVKTNTVLEMLMVPFKGQ